MNFVENPQRPSWQLAAQNALPMFCYIPAEVTRFGAWQAASDRRLADLSWPRNKNHLSLEIVLDLGSEIAAFANHYRSLRRFSTSVKNSHGVF